MVSSSSSARGAARVALVVSLGGIALGALLTPSMSGGPPAAVALFPPGDTTTVYGPTQLSTPNGNATNHVERFAVAVTPGQRYTLRLVNGAPNGSAKVTGGTVQLNGWETMTSADLASGVTIERVVQVRTEDTLFVTVQGPAGAYVTASVLATADPTFLVFGPAHFIRTTGTPVTETRTFTISPTAAPPYRFCLVNGGDDGSNRVSSASIVLNHQEVFTQSQFNQHVASLMTQVSLQPANTLLVTLSGIPGGFLDLCITATDTTPPVITITSPPQNLLTNDTVAIVVGSVDDQTPTTVAINGSATAVSDGAFNDTVPLVEGSNAIHIVATDAAGHVTDSTRTVIRDRTDPVLTVNQPVDGFITNQTSIPVSGTVVDAHEVTVRVNGDLLQVSGDAFTGSALLAEGPNVLLFTAVDAAGNDAPTVMRSGKRDTQPPVIALSSPAEGDSIQADSATLVGTVTDANPKSLTANGIAIPLEQNGSFTGKVPLVVGPNTITLVATDSAENASAPFVRHVVRRNPLPPDPATVASVINRAEATLMQENTSFLYAGASPIQTGVTDSIRFLRAAVIRGRVLDRQLQPLGGALVKIKNHPELGQTLSREDGGYDLAVNGGGSLVLDYAKGGYLPAQRALDVPWQDYTHVGDVILLQPDTAVTVVNLADTTITVARASVQTDADGTRQATVFFEPGTQAILHNADASTDTLTTLSVRATEFTVGENGDAAMPAALPPSSQYTYAIQVTADEQLNAGAGAKITFSQPVPLYVENFLDLDSLKTVPVGKYDPDSARWIPQPNGLMVRIMGTDGQGRAILDINGDGIPDSDSLLVFNGIDAVERIRLAGTFPANSRLWRVPIIETLPYDLNWPFVLLGGDAPKTRVTGPCGSEGADVLRCNLQVQTAFQSVGIVGSPFTLNYASDRTQGNVADRQLKIQLTGKPLPAFLQRVDLDIDIAGKHVEASFTPDTNLSYTFVWDGKDGYGRAVQSTQPALVRISYMYPVVYAKPAPVAQSFGLPCLEPTASCTNAAVPPPEEDVRALRRVAETIQTTLGGFDAQGAGLGGFTLDVQHAYDPLGAILYSGDGTRRVAATLPEQITRWAGTGNPGDFVLDNVPRLTSGVNDPGGIVVAPNGTVYFTDRLRSRVRKVAPNDTITTVAGVATAGYNNDNRLASTAQLNSPTALALGPDGSLYINDAANQRIRRVGTNDTITTVVGTGTCAFAGDAPVIAATAPICQAVGIGIGPDGSLYFAESFTNRIRKVGTDGILRTVAGKGGIGGGPCFLMGSGIAAPGQFESICGEGIPATQALLRNPTGLAVGPDGTVYFANQGGGQFSPRIRRIDPAGFIYVFAGADVPISQLGDGGPAKQAQLYAVSFTPIMLGPDGSVFFATEGQAAPGYNRVRRVRPDGLITTVVGDGTFGSIGDNGPARRARINRVEGIAFMHDGSMLISDDAKVRKVSPPLPGLAAGQTVIVSTDGTELYVLSAAGRILLTLDALTRDTMYKFAYNQARQLVSITDRTGQLTTIGRDSAGGIQSISTPDGRTSNIQASGNELVVTGPDGHPTTFVLDTEGLLQSVTEHGQPTTLVYDDQGRLTTVNAPNGGQETIATTALASGSRTVFTYPTGITSTIESELFPTGAFRLSGRDTSGLVLQVIENDDGSITELREDGSNATTVLTPDPRYGMDAPLANVTVHFPSGSTWVGRTAAAVTLDASNHLTATTDSAIINGAVTLAQFDVLQRRATLTSPAGRRRFAWSDAGGRVVRDSVAGLASVAFAYDSAGHVSTVTRAGRIWRHNYDSLGRVLDRTDPVGRTWRFGYDAGDQPTLEVSPGGDTTRIGYDPNQNIASIAVPNGQVHGFTYSPVMLLESYQPPSVGDGAPALRMTYAADGRLTSVVRQSDDTIAFSYDDAGRITDRRTREGTSHVRYALTGQKVEETSAFGDTVRSAWDGPRRTSETWAGSISGSVSVSYDVNGRAINESANGSSVTVAYDLDGRVSAAGALSYVRDALNGLIQSGTVGSVVTSFSYDGTGATSLSRAAFGGPTIFEQGYTRDAIGRVTQIIETVAAQVDTYGFVYDSVGRVAVVSRNGLPQATYEYDRNGNRVRVTGPSGTTVSGYDAQDRIVAQGATLFGYSRDGERRYRATGSDTTWYTYSAAGELLAVRLPSGTSIDYVVDALGRRIGKKVNGALVRAWLYRGDRTPVAELNSQQQVVSRFVYGARTNAPEYMVRDGRTYRFVTDRLGSVRLVVDVQDGTVAQRLDYDAFGQVTQNSNPGFQPFGFAGGLFDEQTGLVRFGARDYDAATGSWTTRDPAFFQGGASNLYAYANADPVNALDPSGFYTVAELQVVEDEDEGLTASEIQRFQQRLNRLKKFVCSVTSKVAIYSKRAMEILDVMHDHHLLPKGIFGDGPTIAMKGLWHITDLHPLITVALKINGLWGLNSVNWATASPAQKQLAAQVILRATEVFDRACMARDPTYKPIAPILKELLEL